MKSISRSCHPEWSGSRAFSMREHIIGDRVSAIIADAVTAPTSVKAKLGEKRAGQAALEADRHIDGGQHPPSSR